MATHSIILAWRIPWTEESGGLEPMGLQRVRQDGVTKHSTQCTRVCMHSLTHTHRHIYRERSISTHVLIECYPHNILEMQLLLCFPILYTRKLIFNENK